MAYKKNYSTEEKAAYRERKQAEIEEMFHRIDEGVKGVFESEKYKEYLKFASKFTNYSARNTLLISMQKPEATLVAGFSTWKKVGRYVEKGETGIAILAPALCKTNQYLETERPAKDEFGNQIYNPDGTEKMETVQTPVKEMRFKTEHVYDISQTGGTEIPVPVTELSGDIDSARMEAIFSALKKVTGIDIEFEDLLGSAKGYYSPSTNRIVVKSGMSDTQTLKTAFHEAAHSMLHDPKKDIATKKSPRNEKEVQAESVAFVVAERFGMDTSEYSFPYIASWSEGKQLEQLMGALEEIHDTAKRITSEIESELLKMQKRGLTMEEKLADEELNNIQKAEFLIEDYADKCVVFSKEDTDKILYFAGNNESIYETVKLVDDMADIQRQRDNYGYDFNFMTPIDTVEEALEAYDRGEAVYLLYPDNTEGMAELRSEIENFDGYFGIEKELNRNRENTIEKDSELIPVSKEVALEMWDNDLDVYIDGVLAEYREQIEYAPDSATLSLSEFQYSAQLDFERTEKGNVMRNENVNANPNVIGNTPYNELGRRNELEYMKDLNPRHADNIAKQLTADGVRFSGVKKGDTTTITINKADIQRYEAAVAKVLEMYRQNKPQKQKEEPKQFVYGQKNSEEKSYKADETQRNPDIIGNTPYRELGKRNNIEQIKDLNPRHADNIANQLTADGVRFSGLKKGDTTTISINKADMPRYEAAVAKVLEMYRQGNSQKQSYESKQSACGTKSGYASPKIQNISSKEVAPNPNVIGNTPYSELGKRSELEYITNIKNRHAVNVAKQLEADGVRFSGLIKGTVTTITINKADSEKFKAAEKKVIDTYKEQTFADKPRQFGETPPVKKPFYVKSREIASAIDKAISDNNPKLYHYDLKTAAKTVIAEYGIEDVSRTLAEYVQGHDYDGRLSPESKKWAKEFDFPENKYSPVFNSHMILVEGFISRTRELAKELELAKSALEKEQLPEIYSDKFLLSTERVELKDDYRGIPETKYFKSSANEFFIPEIGWLDNAAYDKEQRMSGQNATDFYARVTTVNADYIDSSGRTGQMDMPIAEYKAMTEKTYDKKNAEALDNAKELLNKRKVGENIPLERPTEYYAVRQGIGKKFDVMSISSDDLVTVVKPNIATIAEAKKAMFQIYESKKKDFRCEFVHPQTLDEKSAEMFKNQEKGLPEVTYRICLNKDKNATPDNTHYVQQYIKNDNDTYAIGQIVATGDYDRCNVALAQAMKMYSTKKQIESFTAIGKTETPVKPIKSDFEIYQIKRDEQFHSIRFEPYERLMKSGNKPDFRNYDKVYEGSTANIAPSQSSALDKLEGIFYKFNMERPEDFKGHSLSVSDVVVMDNEAYYVDRVGFKPLQDFIPLSVQHNKFIGELQERLKSMTTEDINTINAEAVKLNIPIETMREACYMSKNEKALELLERYEMAQVKMDDVADSLSEINKPKSAKKPKL